MVTLKDKGIAPTIKRMRTFRCSNEMTAKESTKKYHTSTPSCKNPASNLSQEIELPLSQNPVPEYISTLCTKLNILLRNHDARPSSMSLIEHYFTLGWHFLPKWTLFYSLLISISWCSNSNWFSAIELSPKGFGKIVTPFQQSEIHINFYLVQPYPTPLNNMAPKHEHGETRDAPPHQTYSLKHPWTTCSNNGFYCKSTRSF